MRSLFRNSFVCLFAVTLLSVTGCYEGWEYPTAGNKDGPTDNEPDPQGPPPIAYILFETFNLDSGAVNNTSCFADIGAKEFRQTEWAMRISAAAKALSDITETFVQVNNTVTATDCNVLSKILLRATDTTPWDDNVAPTQDP